MIKKLRVTVDGKTYDVTVEMPEGGEAALAPATGPAVAVPAPQPVAAAPPPAAPAPVAATVAPAPAAETPAAGAGGAGAVPSPLAGRVTAIVVSANQEVKAGDHLLTLEAMKMNTFVFAPKGGKVLSINVAVGDAVNEGDALVNIG